MAKKMSCRFNLMILSRLVVLLTAAILANAPTITVADDLSKLNGVKPNPVKEKKCWQLLNKYGASSYRVNDDWYGKGVMRPNKKNWSLARVKKPGWLLGGDLFYVFENKTEDGFTHVASCRFYSELNEFEFSVNHHSYGGALMCNSNAGGQITDPC